MESRKCNNVKSKRRCFNQTFLLLPHPEEDEHSSVREVAEGVNNTGLGQAHSASASESRLSEESLPYLSSSLDADLEMYNKNRVRICCAQADESKKEADVLGEACDDTHVNCEVCGGVRQSYLTEDSQLEYLSAHEQDFNDGDSLSEFSERGEAVGTQTLKQINPVQEAPEGGVTKEQNIFKVSEDSSHSSECGVGVCTCTEAATPKLFHLHQELSDMICDCQEKKMEYHSTICGSTLESDSCGNKKRVCPNLLASDGSENSEVKGILLTDSTQPPLMAAAAVYEHDDGHVRSTSVRRDNPSHHGNLKNKTADSTIDQAVDVGSDFRVCFTTSRSISARVCLSSRAINTLLTMTNKSQPVGWLCEICAGSACSADWLYGAENVEEIQSQLSDVVEEHWDGHAATAEQQEWCGSNVEISTDRLVQPDKQAVEDSTPSCCQKLLERAVEAELQLLNAHFKMCYQHCLKIYKMALEENMCFHRCNGNAELDSSLILVLEDLKENYDSMRTKIRTGTPLSALPPLSVEIEFFPISCFYVPCEVLRQDICNDPVAVMRKAYFKAPEWNERNIAVNVADPQTVCFIDGHQPSDSYSKTSVEQHEDQDVECGCVKTEERNEDLTVADSSVKPEETKKQQEKQDRVDVREAKTTEHGNECSRVCVGGLSSSVSENTGENLQQKIPSTVSTSSYDAFVSPNALNSSSFTKLMNKLQEIHPAASSDKIVAALLEVQKNNKGVLSGLSIRSIVERTSAVLKKSTPSCGREKESK